MFDCRHRRWGRVQREGYEGTVRDDEERYSAAASGCFYSKIRIKIGRVRLGRGDLGPPEWCKLRIYVVDQRMPVRRPSSTGPRPIDPPLESLATTNRNTSKYLWAPPMAERCCGAFAVSPPGTKRGIWLPVPLSRDSRSYAWRRQALSPCIQEMEVNDVQPSPAYITPTPSHGGLPTPSSSFPTSLAPSPSSSPPPPPQRPRRLHPPSWRGVKGKIATVAMALGKNAQPPAPAPCTVSAPLPVSVLRSVGLHQLPYPAQDGKGGHRHPTWQNGERDGRLQACNRRASRRKQKPLPASM